MAVQVLKPFDKFSPGQETCRPLGDLVKAQQSSKASSSAKRGSNASSLDDDNLHLYTYIPQIQKFFILDGKIGEGTFSHVYKARLKSDPTQTEFAIKFLIPTSHPSRIANELRCLRDMGGSGNVMDVKMGFLHKGHVAIVMPYFPHEKFPDFVCKLSVAEVQEYMKQLCIALKRVHSFNIIHRDVKPSNFLYSRKCKRFSLVDFGLAQRLSDESSGLTSKTSGPLTNALLPPQTAPIRKRTRTPDQENQMAQVKRQCLPAHMGPPLHTLNMHNVAEADTETKKLHSVAATSAKPAPKGTLVTSRRGRSKVCGCFGKNEICSICLSRPAEIAPRAGTPGFRAPEVLLKQRSQTTAVDMWSAGVIFLSLLSGRYPFFRAQDDLTALAEIIAVIGSVQVQLAAEKMGKWLTLSPEKPALDLRTLCESLRGCAEVKVRKTSSGKDKICFSNHESWLHVPDSAYDLLSKLLDPDPMTRITAEDALMHDFLKQP